MKFSSGANLVERLDARITFIVCPLRQFVHLMPSPCATVYNEEEVRSGRPVAQQIAISCVRLPVGASLAIPA